MSERRDKGQISNLFPQFKFQLFTALTEKLKEGYKLSDLRSDTMSGIIVGLVAIPLGMALAIASGVAPQNGLYTVIFAGAIVALLGGSRFQVSGPTAAFVVILAPITQEFGLAGLLIAGCISGVFLILMGISRLGKLIQFIPYPVTTGFTSGIAVVIATLQLKDFLGLKISTMPSHFVGKFASIVSALPTFSARELSIGILCFAILLIWPRINKKIPSPLIALSSVTILVVIIQKFFPEFQVNTIGSSFSFDINGLKGNGIPQALPSFSLPWNFAGPGGQSLNLNFSFFQKIIPHAFAITVLGAIESLLSAVIADGMTQTKHNPDSEIIALGIGNLICPFFGGIPATGAIARTATNIRFGAKSPFSAVIHSLFTLISILLFAPYISYLPMAALAGLLIFVAYNMSEVKHFFRILKVAPGSDVLVLLTCFTLTVLFDMVMGVGVGVVLAALLFMKNMAETTQARKVTPVSNSKYKAIQIPHDIVLYEIGGPLFFGAAEKATAALMDITDQTKGVIFLMTEVPFIDATGLVALEGAVLNLTRKKVKVFIVGLQPSLLELVQKSKITQPQDYISFHLNLDETLEMIGKTKYG